MPTIERYPNYMGVDVTPLSSIKVAIKYVGGVEQRLVLTVGQLVSIGYTTNIQGVTGFETVLGIIKEIGSDPVRKERTLSNYPPAVANPYWIKVDISNTYASDIRHIYIRDIRDIAAGPMADGELAKVEFEGELLPEVNEANISLYIGKIFYLTKDMPIADSSSYYAAGIYIRTSKEWKMLTRVDDILSSPLISSSDTADNVGGVDNIKHYVNHSVQVDPESLNVTTYDDITFIKLNSAVVDATQSKIRANRMGQQCRIELDLIGLKLPAEAPTETITAPVRREIKIADLPEEFRPNRVIENSILNSGLANIGYKISEGVLYFLYTSDNTSIDKINIAIDYIR